MNINWKSIAIVIRKEYLEKIRSKGFIISTLIGPFIMASFFVVPFIVMYFTSGGIERVAVVDKTGKLFSSLERATHSKPKREEKNREASEETRRELRESMKQIDLVPAETENSITLHEMIHSKKITGYLILPENILEVDTLDYVSENASDFTLVQLLERSVNDVLRDERMKQAGINPATLSALSRRAELRTSKLKDNGRTEEDNGGSFGLAFVMAFIIYMSLLLYGTMVMRAVIEEKTSRILEVIASSIKPFELLLGKILGVGAAGLTQFIVWASVIGITSAFGIEAANHALGGALPLHLSIPFSTLVYFVVYFILGYFIYAALYAALGACVDQESDAQQLTMPLTFLVIVPMLLLQAVIMRPDSSLSTVLSLIPFFTPVLMIARITSSTPPLWQIIFSFALMLATMALTITVAAKIYRIGMLLYGKRPTIAEIARWMRTTS